jgi:hypothetical protein
MRLYKGMKAQSTRSPVALMSTIGMLILLVAGKGAYGAEPSSREMPRVRVSDGGAGFVLSGTNQPFVPWGFNYLGQFKRLAEDDWDTEAGWNRIEKDFREMRRLGANVVRWHLQFETYMEAADQPDVEQLARLKRLLKLARSTGLYLDLTGLNCFRINRIPPWYDELSEGDRWKAQAVFWASVAKTCTGDSVVFCYDLMNEPVIAKPGKEDHPWVGGELEGFHFVQRISNRPGGRETKNIAEAWVKLLVEAIREHDKKTLTTVGVIPWAFVWPKAKPVFYSPQVIGLLDFVSIHVYPSSNRLQEELDALAVYDLGKPLVIEEIFPMNCSVADLDKFVDGATDRVDGWIAHYFGYTVAEHRDGAKPTGPLVADFLEYWSKHVEEQ